MTRRKIIIDYGLVVFLGLFAGFVFLNWFMGCGEPYGVCVWETGR